MSYPPAYPHDPAAEIAADIFMVRGSIRMNPIMRISRNMVIVRHQRELTLINPMRLTPAGGSLRSDFDRLLEWRFDSLLSAHGSFLASDAHDAVRAAVEKAFAD